MAVGVPLQRTLAQQEGGAGTALRGREQIPPSTAQPSEWCCNSSEGESQELWGHGPPHPDCDGGTLSPEQQAHSLSSGCHDTLQTGLQPHILLPRSPGGWKPKTRCPTVGSRGETSLSAGGRLCHHTERERSVPPPLTRLPILWIRATLTTSFNPNCLLIDPISKHCHLGRLGLRPMDFVGTQTFIP